MHARMRQEPPPTSGQVLFGEDEWWSLSDADQATHTTQLVRYGTRAIEMARGVILEA